MKLVTVVALCVALMVPYSWRSAHAVHAHMVFSPNRRIVVSMEPFAAFLRLSRTVLGVRSPVIGPPPPLSAPLSDGRFEDEVLRGVEVCIDTDQNTGFVLVRDDVPSHLIEGMWVGLSVFGWYPMEDDDAIETHLFEDGGRGVRVWLYRMARPMRTILRDLKAA